jgi:EF-P beta-lysylation protein EpmB
MTASYLESRHFALNWQQQLAEAFTSVDDLCNYLELNPVDLPFSLDANRLFSLRIPRAFARAIQKGDPFDPLLAQVLPISNELEAHRDYRHDPVGDITAAVIPGLLHKYEGRVLLINTGSCAIHCRYCFRRNFPYHDYQLSKQQIDKVILYIKANPSISEVILSGGDPLTLSDQRLQQLFVRFNDIPHLKRIRIHSRLPIVLPARITDDLINLFKQSDRRIIVVVHCNHPNELNTCTKLGLQKLKHANITLFNQSVLLKNVNDDPEILCQLSEKLFEHEVIPYYLHLLDKATGTAHFNVGKNDALAIYKQMQNRLPGYLLPKLVQEISGEKAKQFI